MSMTPEQLQAWRWEREIDERNRPLTDDELDAMFPEGYKVSAPHTAFKSLMAKAKRKYNFKLSHSTDSVSFLSVGLASTSRLCAHPYSGP